MTETAPRQRRPEIARSSAPIALEWGNGQGKALHPISHRTLSLEACVCVSWGAVCVRACVRVCVRACVCEGERERESACVCVRVCEGEVESACVCG